MKIILVTYDIRKTKSHGSVTFMSPRLIVEGASVWALNTIPLLNLYEGLGQGGRNRGTRGTLCPVPIV